MNQTYVDKDEPCLGILSAVVFLILSTTIRLKGYSMGQLIFGRDAILLIRHTVDWELIRQIKQTKIIKDNICENRNRVDHGYDIRDKVMLNKHSAYKYETPYRCPFVLTRCFTNVMVNLEYGPEKLRVIYV